MKNYRAIIFLLLINILQSYSQTKTPDYNKATAELIERYREMFEKPGFINKDKDKEACEPFTLLSQFEAKDLLPQSKPFSNYLKGLLATNQQKLDSLSKNSIGSNTVNRLDLYLEILGKSKSFKKFAEAITGQSVLDLSAKDKELLIEYYLGHPLKNGASVSSKNKKPAKAKFDNCFAVSTGVLIPRKWKYPAIEWKIVTTVTIVCECEGNEAGEVNKAVFEFQAYLSGVLSPSTISFEKNIQSSLSLESVLCCGFEEEETENTSLEINPTETISLPNMTIGGGLGVGFEQDFEETSFCLGAEFLYKTLVLNKSDLFIGANAKIATTSFMDLNNIQFSAGPTAQLFTPISIFGDTHITNGVGANILFGTNDTNGIKNDISGFEVILNSGLNVRLNNNASLSVILPILSYQNVKFKNQDGDNLFETSGTTLLINKNNPVTLGIRIGLDK
jgi:hypothetical protein